MEITALPPPPADYPYIVAFLVSILAILLAIGWLVVRKVGSFFVTLYEKLEKQRDDERARADTFHEEQARRWEAAEASKQNRGDRLDARITESNAELSDFIQRTADANGTRFAAQEKALADLNYRLQRLEEKRNQ
jgi:hypothetical protein